MAERDERDDSQSTDESVEIPVEVVDDTEGDDEADSESSPAADSSRSGGEDRVESESDTAVDEDESRDESVEAQSGDAADPTEGGGGDEDDDIFLPPDESEVEVVEAEGDHLETTGEEDGDVAELRARIDELEEENEQLREERDEFEERMMRVAADFENFKKRAKRNREEAEKYGAKPLAEDLLTPIDNLERALEHAKSSEEENIIDGVEMVVRQVHSTLEKHGVEVFDAIGDIFDPEKHEAIQQVETPDHESGEVLEQFQRGYFIHDRLLRPALVAVAEKIEAEDAGDQDSQGDEQPEEADASDQD